MPNVIINSACRRNGFPHLTLTYTEKKYSLVRKKNGYKIRELDSVNVHENEALVKGNKQKQKKKQKKKKRNNTFRKQKITSLASLEWTWYGSI